MTFIKKLEFNIDIVRVQQEFTDLINQIGWPDNQIGVKHRPNAEAPWTDAISSLYDEKLHKFTSKESDFTEWNPIGEYTRHVIEELGKIENKTFGRIRFMRLMSKTGLSIHADFEKRYHLVLNTNPCALFGEYTGGAVAATCYHIPADGHFYHVDTTRKHFVYNGGWEPRIHLVICEVESP
jgi:hypothetical protein